MLRLSLRDLRAHVGRYVLTFIAVAIGVAFVAGVGVLTDTLTRTFDDMISDFADGIDAQVRGKAEVEIPAEFGGGTRRPKIDAALVDEVSAIESVSAVDPFIQGTATLLDSEGEAVATDFGPPTIGTNWSEVPETNPWKLTEGSRAPERPGEVVVDKGTADRNGYELDGPVGFQTPEGVGEATVVGIARFGTADSPLGASFIMFSLEEAEEQFAEPGQLDGMNVVAEEGVSQVELRDRVRSALSDGDLEVVTGDTVRDETQDDFAEQFSFFRIILGAFAGLAIVVGTFVIYTSFSFIVAQRQRQVALIRAVGASRRQVLWSVIVESLTLGVIASLVGYALGVGLAVLLSTLMMDGDAQLAVLPGSFVAALLVGVLVTVGSAYIPARRASKTPPIAAIRHAAIDTSGRSVKRLVAGFLFMIPGAVCIAGLVDGGSMQSRGLGIVLIYVSLVIFGPAAARPATAVIGAPVPRLRGVVGRLAQQNAARNPRRTAATASALMFCMGAVSLILVVLASIYASIDETVDDRFFGDFVVASATFTGPGLPPDTEEEINSLPEVDVAAGVRVDFAEIDGKSQPVAGVTPERAFDLYDVGITDGSIEGIDDDGIAVYEKKAEDNGWRVGDTLTVVFPEAPEPQTFTIAALTETKDLLGDFVVNTSVFEKYVPTSGDMQILVRLKDGVSLDEGRQALDSVVDEIPSAKLQDLQEFKDATKEQFQPLLIGILVLLMLTVIVAVIGIVNTMILSVVERTREIGLIRAVGALRSQIRSTIRWEALVIAGFGVVGALSTGVLFGWVLVNALRDEGFTEFAVPVGQLVGVALITALLTLLAAVFPAAWAGRRPILTAIATE